MHDHWTIIIGSNYGVAQEVRKYHAFGEAMGDDFDYGLGIPTAAFTAQYEAVAFTEALRKLQGARPTRIVIADYLNWHSNRPGHLADVWDQIQRMQIMFPSMKVTFLP